MQILAKFLAISLLATVLEVTARISDQRLCADEKCSVPVSIARSVLSYHSDDSRILSFKPSETITIYSKSAGSRLDLWGAEINGKRGYVPKDFLREFKILKSNLKHTVPTEYSEDDNSQENQAEAEPTALPPINDETLTTLPDAAEGVTENDPNVIVVDGTTIYMPEDAEIEKTVAQKEKTKSPPPAKLPPPEKSQSKPPQEKKVNVEEPLMEAESVPEHTTPEPEAPPAEVLVAAKIKEVDDGSTEAVSEPPETGKDESVMNYLSDTLTGWMDHSGSGDAEEDEDDEENEEADTGQSSEKEIAEKLIEKAKPEPPESNLDVEVDLSKINLLSVKGNIEQPLEVEAAPDSAEDFSEKSEEVTEASTEVPSITEEIPKLEYEMPEEPPVMTIPTPYPDPYNTMSSDEINNQYSSYSSTPAPIEEASSSDEINHQYSSYSSSPAPLEETSTETPNQEVPPPEEAKNEIPNIILEKVDPETPKELPEPVQEEVITSSQENFEDPSHVKVITPPQEEVTTPATPEMEILRPAEEVKTEGENVEKSPDAYNPYTNLETGQQVEATTGVLADNDDYPYAPEDTTTPLTPPASEETSAPEETTEAPDVEESSGGIFADWVYNLFGYSSEKVEEVTESARSELDMLISEPVEETTESGSWFWSSTPTPEVEQKPTEEVCTADAEGCAVEIGVTPSSPPADTRSPYQQSVSEQVSTMDWEDVVKSGTLTWLVVTAVTVLLFSLGHYFIEKKRVDGALISKINILQKELLVSTKECLILRDDLDSTKDKLSGVETTSSDSSETVTAIRVELIDTQRVCQEQEEQIKSLEMELEAATEAGLELNKMLSEFLSTQRGSENLVQSVELLQSQLNKQQTTISTMNQSINIKTEENESIKTDLSVALEKVNQLEMEVAQLTVQLSELQAENAELKEELDGSNESMANQLQEASNMREMEVDALKKKLEASEAKLVEAQNSLKYRNSELETLRDGLSKLEQMRDENKDKAHKKLEAMLDVSKAQAELKLLRSERDVLKERLQCEEDARQLLEDHVKVIKSEVEKLNEKGEAAEREKQDALTRLEVLSEYFKEKEAQLQKELGLQEAICVMKNEDVSVTQTRIKTMQDEIESFKAQNEALKQEIHDQERSLKGQITTLEKKAHDNWIAARHAERKLEETKQESSTLRNRLTMLEKSPSLVTQNGEDGKGVQRLLETNGGDLPTSPALHIGDSPTMSPHYMPLPPPPLGHGAFMPPPPPPEYMHQSPTVPLYPDRRPPPLGRMSSPPPPHHFSPPPDRFNSPYRPRSPGSDRSLPRYRYGSRSPSPPPYHSGDYPPYHSAGRQWEEPRGSFRPVQRDKELQGSTVSSGHSSSDSVGKSSSHRSGKRGGK